MNKLLITIVILVIAIGGYFFFRKSPPSTPTTSISFKKGEQAPNVTLIDVDGGKHSLSDYTDQVVVLDLWASWCPFCVAEMPELQKAQDAYTDLVMIGVHRTDTESISIGQKFANDVGVSYLLVTDSDGSLYKAAGGFGMPVAVFIDKNGVVTEVKSGPKTVSEIQQKIEALVK